MLDVQGPTTSLLYCQVCGEEATVVYGIPQAVEFHAALAAGSVNCDCGGRLGYEPKPKSLLLDAAGKPL